MAAPCVCITEATQGFGRAIAEPFAGSGLSTVDNPLPTAELSASGFGAALEQQNPLGRFAQAVDIGGAAVFLASPAASRISGQILYIDGDILANQMTWKVRT